MSKLANRAKSSRIKAEKRTTKSMLSMLHQVGGPIFDEVYGPNKWTLVTNPKIVNKYTNVMESDDIKNIAIEDLIKLLTA